MIEIWKRDMFGKSRIAWYPQKKKKKAYKDFEDMKKKYAKGEIFIREV